MISPQNFFVLCRDARTILHNFSSRRSGCTPSYPRLYPRIFFWHFFTKSLKDCVSLKIEMLSCILSTCCKIINKTNWYQTIQTDTKQYELIPNNTNQYRKIQNQYEPTQTNTNRYQTNNANQYEPIRTKKKDKSSTKEKALIHLQSLSPGTIT